MSSLEESLRRLVTPCTVVALAGQRSSGPLATCFGGPPYAERGDAWPVCGGCGAGLTFVFQWNAGELPHAPRPGLYVFYYCFNCNSWGDESDRGKSLWLLRRYAAPSAERSVHLDDRSPQDNRCTPCAVRIEPALSLPDWQGIDEIEPELTDAAVALNSDNPWEVYDEVAKAILGSEPTLRTQVGGYPLWVQGEGTPDCRRCERRMRLLAQIDSEDEASIMWGDCGCVYLFGCEEHTEEFRLELQCY
ncbi:MAG: DUF1963 domain-containing protein [Phycisphaerales bacterium]